MDSDRDYYQILGVGRTATEEEIKHSFRMLAKKYHPDSGTYGNAALFEEIDKAYQTLCDPSKRDEYNKHLSAPKPEPVPPPPAEQYYNRQERSVNFYWAKRVDEYSQRRISSEPLPKDYVPNITKMSEGQLRERVRIYPNSVKAQFDLAYCLVEKQKNYLEAERILEGIYCDYPGNPLLVYTIAVAKYHLGDLDDAEKFFKTCLRMNPQDGDTYVNLAYLQHKKGESMDVMSIVSSAPFDARKNYLFWLLLGEFQQMQKDYRRAITYLEEAIRLNPKSVKARTTIANCLWAINKFTESLAYYTSAAQIEPNNLSTSLDYAIRAGDQGVLLGTTKLHDPSRIDTIDRNIRLRYNQNAVAILDLKEDDVLVVDVMVMEGARIDVLFMDKDNFDRFVKSGPYNYRPELTRVNTDHIIGSVKIIKSGTYCLIVENSFLTPGGTEPNITDNAGSVHARVQIVIGCPGKLSAAPSRPNFGSTQKFISESIYPTNIRPAMFRIF